MQNPAPATMRHAEYLVLLFILFATVAIGLGSSLLLDGLVQPA
ncbi:MAG TPA: hypothetical protein VK149_09280 [Sideroxyarcus sp.]|nr:hypothetical protein [Sideroxyarcus sp.]